MELTSYEVHEKSILLAVVPLALLIREDPALVTWLQLLGTFSMFPLLVKDGLRIPYVACCALAASLSYSIALCHDDDDGGEERKESTAAVNSSNTITEIPPKAITTTRNTTATTTSTTTASTTETAAYSSIFKQFRLLFFILSYIGMVLLHILELYWPAPTRYPDLYAALFSIYGALNLCIAYLMGLYWQWNFQEDSDDLSDSKLHFD